MELLIHPEELSPRWIALAKKHGLKRLSIHPWGGKNAHKTLAELVELLESPAYRAMIDTLIDDCGVEVGYEFHAASYLVPRELFDEHPEYFRMDENGNRVPDRNFCFSNPEVVDILARNAAILAKKLYRAPKDYYFWLDDARTATCHCPECRKKSFSDHQLNMMNRMLREIRKDDPEAKMCYLAYYEALPVPKTVKPDDGIFLEYAPIDRFRNLGFDLAGENLETLKGQLAFFGKDDAKVLEYWYDNSLFSKWKKPPVSFIPDNDAILEDYAFYRALGFRTLSSFACFLGEDYIELYGEPDLSMVSEG